MTSISSVPSVSPLPVPLSLCLNPRPIRVERGQIPTVLPYPSVEGQVAVLAVVLRKGGYQLIQLDSDGFGEVLVPSSSINSIRDMKLEILRPVYVEFHWSFVL